MRKTAICTQGEGQFAFLSFYGTIAGHFSPMCFVVQNSPLQRGSRLFRNRRKRAHSSGGSVGGGRGGGGEGVYGIINYQVILLAHSCIFTTETSFFLL